MEETGLEVLTPGMLQDFRDLYQYIEDDEVTDIDWDAGQLWIKRSRKKRCQVRNERITESYMYNFALRTALLNSRGFNPVENVVCCDTENLRITCIDKSFAASGLSIGIRKSLPRLRFTAREAVREKYCDERLLHLMVNCVLVHKNFVFCGNPGSGKTEAAKFFSHYIPDHEKVITIEDVKEWHYKKINPTKDGIELKIQKEEDFQKSLAVALRMNPVWIMLAETRSREVRYLLECWSNGVSCMTTLHANDVRKIPDRILNMLDTRQDAKRIVNQIYSDLGIGILLEVVEDRSAVMEAKMEHASAVSGEETEESWTDYYDSRHRIAQVCFYYRTEDRNVCAVIVEDGKFRPENIPKEIERELKKTLGTEDLFHCPLLGGEDG